MFPDAMIQPLQLNPGDARVTLAPSAAQHQRQEAAAQRTARNMEGTEWRQVCKQLITGRHASTAILNWVRKPDNISVLGMDHAHRDALKAFDMAAYDFVLPMQELRAAKIVGEQGCWAEGLLD